MKRPFLVSFSGMDGSGKTHLIILLRRFFRRQGISYLYIHSVRDSFANRIAKKIPSFSNLVRPKIVYDAQEEEPILSVDNKLKARKKISSFSLAVRKTILFFDALYLQFRIAYLWKNYDVIIFDRYIYDRITQIAYLGQRDTVDFSSWLVKIFPRPNLPLYLHITPDQAIERKKEVILEGQGLEYFHIKYKLLEEGKLLWKLFAIDNSMLSLSEAKKKMISIFKKRYFKYKRNK